MKYRTKLLTILLLGQIEAHANLANIHESNNSTLLEILKWENKILEAQFERKELTQKNQKYNEKTKYQNRLEKLKNDAELAEIKADKVTHEISVKKVLWESKTEKIESELTLLKMKEERSHYVDSNPIYLDDPLTKENKLIISDRRISLDGLITSEMASEITNKINYYNNKDNGKPIFLVINSSPGGSVMAGYLIIKAMESSKAPIYVVLQSFAASMAAIIVTMADKSFAYSHATMLHHQPSMFQQGSSNLTEQKENYKNLEKWWNYLGEPIAKKMGITLEEFQKKMYQHSSKGDWSEFAEDAQKLKWVNHIVSKIEDTSIMTDRIEEKKENDEKSKEVETISKNGKPIQYLPHLSPTDAFFLYSPDGYYQSR
jgi:ATP-dependent Clp protease protease subunit